ncbi:hypothetical protein FHS43_004411 [Streptosporangium becharense]|uniref:Uncharacterized protein n=1 Tax=Streptosporangium becharense TaxID=1816182 RepID=A0A7W9IKR0_9ACTN|nr:hypothetical protein [Streptosporangium becharense]MBB5822096.1 hypothetical protein [Streptosporangium becharense]
MGADIPDRPEPSELEIGAGLGPLAGSVYPL